MKYIVLVPDGAADHPIEELDDLTPLQAANTPNLDFLSSRGVVGLVNTIPQAMPPGSDVANLSLLGYNPREFYTGRGAFEAASMGVALEEGEYAFRLNLVTTNKKNMLDYSAGHISNEEAFELIKVLKKHFKDNQKLAFYPGISYRHLMVAKGDYSELSCTPPHDITGQPIKENLPSGSGMEEIIEIMNEAKEILEDHPINKERKIKKLSPANSVWLWGQGESPKLPSFESKFSLKGAIISAVNLINGIGICAGLKPIKVEGATGYLDTNYKGKAIKAINSLEEFDFVYVHIEAPDEAGHSGIIKDKIKALEDFDKLVVGPVLSYVQETRICKIMVVPDHATPLAIGTHLAEAVPFVIYSCEEITNKDIKFNEFSARESQLWISRGHELMENFIRFTKIE